MEKTKEKQEAKAVFSKVQMLLDTLQGKDATCLFIGYEGNHFVISGDFNGICAQLIFAMCRYPIVTQIVKKCASRFDELNAEYGDNVRSVTLDHLIEQNSGNEP